MVGTITARDPIYDTVRIIQMINILARSFHDKAHTVSVGMNTSSRSTPTSSMHNLSFYFSLLMKL